VLGRFERPLPLPESIDKPVLARGAGGGGFAPQPAE
jgi:hypothetical protein